MKPWHHPLAASLVLALTLGGCVVVGPAPGPGPGGQPYPAPYPAPATTPVLPRAPGETAAAGRGRFAAVVARVEPVARQICEWRGLGRCDFAILVDARPGLAPNASQSLGPDGRPVLTFTASLLEMARNADEIAFVMGHEAAHHIAGHLPQTRQTAMTGALIGAVLAGVAGGTDNDIDRAQRLGAGLAARSYSKEFELQADGLGAEIAWRAGYDPELGAAFFDQLPDPGDQFLGSHPANADRKRIVMATVARLRNGG